MPMHTCVRFSKYGRVCYCDRLEIIIIFWEILLDAEQLAGQMIPWIYSFNFFLSCQSRNCYYYYGLVFDVTGIDFGFFFAEKPRLSQFEFSNTMKISIPIGVVAVLALLSVIIISLRVYCSRRTSRDRRRREKASTPLKTDPPDGCDSDEKNPDVIPLGMSHSAFVWRNQF